ncbi:LysR family transcriptional regulator [Celeribacter halophilus]|uniref:LysR family transcriptional regulator n=1 Tax=Celeribacter halophilus TaxID=576117 RepID=UPI003A935352
MNIRQLKLFTAIYETHSVTKAAGRLFISQPAASKMLAALEQEVGYELFHREGGRLQPSPEANLLAEEVEQTLHGFDQLDASFKRAGRGARGIVRLAAIPGPSLGFLPGLVRDFQKKWPDSNIIMKIRNSGAVREMVATGQADIGISDTGLQSPHYSSMPIRMTCLCAIHRANPAASNKVLTPKTLGATNWITYGSEHETFHQLLDAYQQAGMPFHSNLTVDTAIQALLMVELNSGSAITDPLSINLMNRGNVLQLPDVVIRPFQPSISESVDVISVNSRPMSSAAKAFLVGLHSALRAQQRLEETQA